MIHPDIGQTSRRQTSTVRIRTKSITHPDLLEFLDLFGEVQRDSKIPCDPDSVRYMLRARHYVERMLAVCRLLRFSVRLYHMDRGMPVKSAVVCVLGLVDDDDQQQQ